MAKQRSFGMTLIGGLNVLLGGIGVIAVVFVFLGSCLALALHGLDPRRFDLEIPGGPGSRHGISLLLAPYAGVLDALLVAAGIQTLRMAPSARKLSLLYAGFALPLSILDFSSVRDAGPFEILRIALCLLSPFYSVLLIVLFLLPSWKKAFAK
jgi:hypothetical protein